MPEARAEDLGDDKAADGKKTKKNLTTIFACVRMLLNK